MTRQVMSSQAFHFEDAYYGNVCSLVIFLSYLNARKLNFLYKCVFCAVFTFACYVLKLPNSVIQQPHLFVVSKSCETQLMLYFC